MAESVSPFVPGARVAINNGWDNWHEDFVEKVHKTGRFTLKGRNQQWRPLTPWGEDGYWQARETGRSGFNRTYLRVWDAAADAEISKIFGLQSRKKRRTELVEKLEHLKDGELTDAMLDQIAAALPPQNIHERKE